MLKVQNIPDSDLALYHYQLPDFNTDLRRAVSRFTKLAQKSRILQKNSNFTNYSEKNEFSLDDLLFEKKRFEGYISIENAQREIQCASGYYKINNYLLGGVRALSLPSSVSEHKFLHASHILKFQRDIAVKRQLSAFVIAVNLSNERVWRLMKAYAKQEKIPSNPITDLARQFFSSLQFYEEPIMFNSCMQKICFYSIEQFSPQSLNGYTFLD